MSTRAREASSGRPAKPGEDARGIGRLRAIRLTASALLFLAMPPRPEAAAGEKVTLFVFTVAAECGPPVQLRQAFGTTEVARASADLHVREVDFATPDGRTLGEAHGVRKAPTLLALDSSGGELGRLVGFPGQSALITWLVSLDAKPGSVAAVWERVQKQPGKKHQLLLGLARRIIETGQREGVPELLRKASYSQDPNVSIGALKTLEELAPAGAERRTAAQNIARRFPATEEGAEALSYLATTAPPPRAIIRGAVSERLEMGDLTLATLDRLLWVSQRANLLPLAKKIHGLIQAEPTLTPYVRNLYAAEMAHVEGRQGAALAALQAASEAVSDRLSAAFLASLRSRYERGLREPADVSVVTLIDGVPERYGNPARSEPASPPPAP